MNDLVDNYNNTDHKSLGTTPTEAIENNDKYEEKAELQTDKARQRTYNRDSIEVGTHVRLKIRKGLFEKDSQKWTKSLHIISEIKGKDYFVSDRVDPYRKQDLQVVGEDIETPDIDVVKEREEEHKEKKQKIEKRISRRINKEGIEKRGEDTEEQKNAKALRRYKPRDMGFMLLD
jgi:hypothetical protein